MKKKWLRFISFFLIVFPLISCVDNNNEKPDIAMVTAFTAAFDFDETHYICDLKYNCKKEEIADQLGFFVNRKDYIKWVEFDNNPKYKYIIDENDRLVNVTGEENLLNRFKIFYIKESEDLALKVIGTFYLFKKETN